MNGHLYNNWLPSRNVMAVFWVHIYWLTTMRKYRFFFLVTIIWWKDAWSALLYQSYVCGFRCNEFCSVERMTVNHDVTGSSPVRGAKKKRSHRVRSFLFFIKRKRTCDIMILKSSVYRLSDAKLVVFDVKGTKQAFLKEIYDLRAKTLCACRVALDVFAQNIAVWRFEPCFCLFPRRTW